MFRLGSARFFLWKNRLSMSTVGIKCRATYLYKVHLPPPNHATVRSSLIATLRDNVIDPNTFYSLT